MLSVFDLLEAETLPLDLAAYLMAHLTGGASFLVGAVPGGAGKTTVMCALLNLVPADVELVAATPEAVSRAAHTTAGRRRCFICHEIGRGSYFAYLWGEPLRCYCRLGDSGHLLATNLHADGIDETRDQICVQNAVPPTHFKHFDLLLYLRVDGDMWHASRRISRVYDLAGGNEHRLVYDLERNVSPCFASGEPAAHERYIRACGQFLSHGLTTRIRTIEDTRSGVLRFLGAQERQDTISR
jgi:hypothetical protein